MVLPFGGEIVTAELSGKELKTYLEFVVFELTAGSGSFPQMSGLEITGDKIAKKLKKIVINGKQLVESQKYVLALPEFIAAGGDKYPKLNFKKFGYMDADILKDFILSKKVLKSQDYSAKGYIKAPELSKSALVK